MSEDSDNHRRIFDGGNDFQGAAAELGYDHLVHGRVRVPRAGGDLFADLEAKAKNIVFNQRLERMRCLSVPGFGREVARFGTFAHAISFGNSLGRVVLKPAQKKGSRSMNAPYKPDLDLEMRLSRRLLDVFIRAGLVFALAVLCYRIFSPFISLMAWALILAVTLYPAHQKLAHRMGGKQGRAATLLVLGGIVLIVVPTTVLMASLGDSVHDFVVSVRDNTLQIPAPPASVAEWPVVGKKVHGLWSQAHADLPAVVQSMQPKLGDLAKKALGMVASIAGAVLLFLFSFIIAGIIMAFGQSGAESTRSIFDRIVGIQRGEEFAKLSTATIRTVAQGVLGVAFIQAIVVGLVLMIAGVPFAGVLAMIVLVLGIAQVPALLVTLPVIGYIWSSGDYGTAAAVIHTVLLLLAGMLDNVLKPLLLGRGVDAPMPVILLGALGGLASTGILGMFVGATLLALGYQIFMAWVAANPDTPPAERESQAAG
jgi:predicted PurR-regulated permease PerM